MTRLFTGLTIDNVWVAGCGADGGSREMNYRNIEEILVKKKMYDDLCAKRNHRTFSVN